MAKNVVYEPKCLRNRVARTATQPRRDDMNELETLTALLDMTKEAEELTSDIEKSERLRSLVVEIRCKARDEYKRLRQDRRKRETRFQTCMIGILEELYFGKISWQNITDLEARLGRIHEDIDRTVAEIKANRKIM